MASSKKHVRRNTLNTVEFNYALKCIKTHVSLWTRIMVQASSQRFAEFCPYMFLTVACATPLFWTCMKSLFVFLQSHLLCLYINKRAHPSNVISMHLSQSLRWKLGDWNIPKHFQNNRHYLSLIAFSSSPYFKDLLVSVICDFFFYFSDNDLYYRIIYCQ